MPSSNTTEVTEHSQASDAALIKACRQGDQLAWRSLVDRYAKLIYQIPLRRGLSPDQASDVFQNVFVLLVEKLDRIEQPDRIHAWLVTTARWETARVLRSQIYKSQVPLSADEQEVAQDPAPELDDLLIGAEEQQIVKRGLSMLDPRCADLLRMLFCQLPTPSYSKVAQTLGISEGSIGPTRARCLDKLRRILNEIGL
jgi:RNA polymerase sigma factor (sigma-70 family)